MRSGGTSDPPRGSGRPAAWAALAFVCAFGWHGVADAVSRLYDGKADAWMEEGRLCFGATGYKSPSMLFPRNLRIARNDVEVRGISLSTGGEEAWLAFASATGRPWPLRAGECVLYGRLPEGWGDAEVAAMPLRAGVYQGFVELRDRKRGYGPRLELSFCLEPEGDTWRVLPHVYDRAANRRVCADG